MARNGIILLWVGIVAIFMCSGLHADVPQMINYQGKLTTATGGCLNDTVQMTFSIYPDTLSSPADWTETQTEVVVKEGVFSVLLGSVNPIPDTVFDGSTKYFGVQVESDPEMRPLKPMVSVAYAFKSLEADTANYARAGAGDADNDWTIRGDNIYHSNGYVGIGTENSGTCKLVVQHNDNWASRFLNSNGADVRLAHEDGHGIWANSSDTTSNRSLIALNSGEVGRFIVLNNGNVGIGTTSPSAKLHVQHGNFKVDGLNANAEIGGNVSLATYGSAKVGIGTTSPSQKLSVNGSAEIGGLYFASQPPHMIMQMGTSGDLTLKAGESDPPGTGGASLTFISGNAPKAYFLNGNVGINTTVPSAALNVNQGDIRITGAGQGIYFPDGSFQTSAGTGSASSVSNNLDAVITGDADANGSGGVKLRTGSTDKLTVLNNGNVGIGTTSPTRNLMVSGDVDIKGADPEEQLRVENESNDDNADGIFARTRSHNNAAGVSADAIEETDGDTYGVLGVTKARSTRAKPGYPDKSNGSAAGVYGWAAYTGNTGDVFGVLGVCDGIGGTGPGPNAAAGVYGLCTKDTGKNYGVFGETKSRNTDVAGVYGIGNNTDGRVHGVLGLTQSDEEGSAGVFGVAQASTGITYGVYGRSNSSSGYGGYFDGGLHCINGDITVENGNKLALVPTSQGMTGLYCQESPEIWFEDFGEGELKNGFAHIDLDALFLETVTISEKYPMKVFVQLNDHCNGVYVKRGTTGFDVYELNDGKSNAHFTYRVVAKRKGYEDKRLEVVEEQLSSK